MDHFHIPKKYPRGGNEAKKKYYDFKNFHRMMGIVEADYKFLWTFAGLPGSLNDAGTIFPYRYYMHI